MLTCPMGKDPCKSSSMLILNLEKGTTALAKQYKFASCLPKGQAEMQDFLSPGWDIATILITNNFVETETVSLEFIFSKICYIYSSHLSSHSNVPLSFPNVEPYVFWSTETPVIPKSTLGKGKCTQVFQDF